MNGSLKIVVGLFILFGSPARSAQPNYFSNWPVGRSPQEVGTRLAAHFVTSPHELYPDGGLLYAEAGTWLGALRFAEVIHDAHLRDELVRRFQPLLPAGAEANRVPTKDDALHAVFGIVPLQLYMTTKDPKYFAFGTSFADAQWDKPLPNGLSHQTSGYVDADMYMLPMLQLQAYRDRRTQVSRPWSCRDGCGHAQAAATERPLLPHA